MALILAVVVLAVGGVLGRSRMRRRGGSGFGSGGFLKLDLNGKEGLLGGSMGGMAKKD